MKSCSWSFQVLNRIRQKHFLTLRNKVMVLGKSKCAKTISHVNITLCQGSHTIEMTVSPNSGGLQRILEFPTECLYPMEKQNEIAVKSHFKELLAPWMRKVCESSLQTQKKDPNILLFASQLSAQRLASMPTSVLEEQEDEVVQNRPPEDICLDTALPRCRACGASEQHLGHGGRGGC